jgi:hypothetical protein
MKAASELVQVKSSRRGFLLATSAGVLATTVKGAIGQSFSDANVRPAPTTEAKAGNASAPRSVAVVWRDEVEGGEVELTYALLNSLDGKPARSPGAFQLEPGVRRLQIHIDQSHTDPGAYATRVTVRFRGKNAPPETARGAFTFFLRDVAAKTPIFIRGLNVAVVCASDFRTYEQIEAAIRAKRLHSVRDVIDAEPEETYEGACRGTKEMRCPTWLGVGRDMRIFRVMPLDSTGYWGYVEPCDLRQSSLPKEGREPGRYYFILGRGARCSVDIQRRLEDGVLPIVKSTQLDGDIEYRLTIFATLEKGPLTADNVRGTHWLAAFAHAAGAMLTKREASQYNDLASPEVTHREQELICWVHVEAVNKGRVPRYAYAKAGYIKADALEGVGKARFIDGQRINSAGRVSCMNLLNGKPMPQEEMAILIQPGEEETLDILFPHRPLTRDRGRAVCSQSYDAHHQSCRSFWRGKLAAGAQISLPDANIEERVRAGLLHLDITTLGLSKSGPLAAVVGWYAPIRSGTAALLSF